MRRESETDANNTPGRVSGHTAGRREKNPTAPRHGRVAPFDEDTKNGQNLITSVIGDQRIANEKTRPRQGGHGRAETARHLQHGIMPSQTVSGISPRIDNNTPE